MLRMNLMNKNNIHDVTTSGFSSKFVRLQMRILQISLSTMEKTSVSFLPLMTLADHTIWERKSVAKLGLSLSNSHHIGSVKNSLTTAKKKTSLIAEQKFCMKQGIKAGKQN